MIGLINDTGVSDVCLKSCSGPGVVYLVIEAGVSGSPLSAVCVLYSTGGRQHLRLPVYAACV